MKYFLQSLLVFCCLMIVEKVHSQTVTFSYDNAGNRISRTLETQQGGLKSLGRIDTIVIEEEIEEDVLEAETNLFPNPTSGLITIEFYPDDEQKYFIAVNTISGYLLINQEIFKGENIIDISKYPPGSYLITIYSEKIRKQWNILKI